MFTILLTFGLVAAAYAEGTKDVAEARQILDRYLATVHPKGPAKTDPYDPKVDKQVNEARLARLAILAELTSMPDEAVSAAERVIFERADSHQRYEIVDALSGLILTRQCAELLQRVRQDVRKPKDQDATLYEELVRSSAVHGLRMMARRTDRTGGKRTQRTPDFPEKITGLVPYLVEAANDPAERVRVSALFALADSRDSAAVAELRNRLKDESERVRLYAACFLTEYMDATGLPEMRNALDRFKKTESEHAFDHYAQVEMLLASLERITGKSFGEIPLNPVLCSSDGGEARRYQELLDTWHAWWSWQPDG